MFWFFKGSGSKRLVLTSTLVGLAGITLASAQPAQAADLDYDGPRYGAVEEYWEDRDPDWRGPRRHSHYDRHCVPRDEVRRELIRDGWRNFRHAEARGSYALVEARRGYSDRPYLLKIDRCSGHIVSADPIAPRRTYLRAMDDDDWSWRRSHRAPWRWASGPRRYRYDY